MDSRPYCPQCGRLIRLAEAAGCRDCDASRPESGWPGDPLIGRQVVGDQYRVLRRIGAGGFGVVYEVETVVGGLRRALKVLNANLCAEPHIAERFINEAIVLEQINHSNVTRCFAVGRLEETEQLYLLLELVRGRQLGRVLTEGEVAPFTPQRAVRIAKQIAAGLVAAHRNDVLHRDLKPENILVIHPGKEDEHVKIVDFGIAKLTAEGATSTQTIIGTPAFMAPEQFTPGTTIDLRVDLWQFGAILFFMLTGRGPYRVDPSNPLGIQQQHLSYAELGPKPSSVVPALAEHGALDAFVGKLLATRVDQRPRSVEEVSRTLARIEQELLPARKASAAESLVESLCSQPSPTGWLTLCRYLPDLERRSDDLESLADAHLQHWPDRLRTAAAQWWDSAQQGEPHPMWSLARALDLSGRGLDDAAIEALAGEAAGASLRILSLANNAIGSRGAAALATSSHLRNLRELDLSNNRLGEEGVAALARGRLGSLASLDLSGNTVGVRGAVALAKSEIELETLRLDGCMLRTAGIVALVDGMRLSQLRRLSLGSNQIGPDGIAALAVAALPRLTRLDISNNAVGPSGAAALALSSNLDSVRRLSMAQNGLGKEGLHLLLSSTHLGSVDELDLAGNLIGAAAIMHLASSAIARRLQGLCLDDNDLGDAGLAAVLGSSNLAGLRRLRATNNRLTAAGASLFGGTQLQLELLDLSDNRWGDDGAAALAETLGGTRIHTLALRRCGMTAEGVAAILRRARGRLRSLDVSGNALFAMGAQALAEVEELQFLEQLDLSNTGLDATSLVELLGSPHLRSLRHLSLAFNHLGDAGIAQLVRLPSVAQLESLELCDNDLGPETARALGASLLATRLRKLDLSHNHLGNAGVEILARQSVWHSLTELSLAANEIDLSGVSALMTAPGLALAQRIDLSRNALAGSVDLHSLGRGKVELLESSFAEVLRLGTKMTASFYQELFSRYPTIKPLFSNTDMRAQQRHLLQALTFVIENLRRPDKIESTLVAMGERHLGYGALPTHYFAVTSTLVHALGETLGESWTDELRDAWADGLDAVSSVMLSVYGTQSRRPPPGRGPDPEAPTEHHRPR